MKQILILSSANGSNFEAIVKYFKNRTDICLKLLCDNKNAKVIKRAEKLKIETFIIEKKEEIFDFLQKNKFDLVVMAGFFKILDKKTILSNKFINIHPSLLPKHKGLKAIKKAFLNKDKKTGITIHFANEEVDAGEIIFQKEIEIKKNWNLAKLEQELHKLEHYFYPRIIEKLLGLNVLVVGSGGREHAIADKISQSKFLNRLYLADPNDGFSHLGEKINYKNYKDLVHIAKEKNINLVVIGGENYLAAGLIDIFNKKGIKTIGPCKKWAKLEASKLFAKKMMQKYDIKTSFYKKIDNKKNIDKILKLFKNPVIKADGLALGKGVFIGSNIEEIKNELKKFLDGKYGLASKKTLVEEKLEGFEASLFSFWDGENLIHFPLCKDYKKNDDGLNTGGLGAICPFEIDKKNEQKLEIYKQKLENLLKKEKIKTPFIIYSGLMFSNDDVYILEYNVRLGDPETQVLLNYITSDWLEIFYNCANKMLNSIKLEYNTPQTCVVVASKGYPLKIKKNILIENIESNIKVYFSNVIKKEDRYYSNGGRVLSFVDNDKNKIYNAIEKLNFSEKMFRKDI